MAKGKGTTREVHERTFGKERDKMIEATTAEINKRFGTGAIMRFGHEPRGRGHTHGIHRA